MTPPPARCRSCRRRPGRSRMYFCGPTVYAARARRERPAVRDRHVAAALAPRQRLRRHPRPQHHRRQRQDLRGRAGRERRARRQGERLVHPGHRRPGARPPRPRAEGDRVDPGDRRADRGADRARPRLRGRRRRLLPRRALPGLRRLLPAGSTRSRSGTRPGGRAERAQGRPARFRAVEGAQAGRGHVVGLAVGPRPARLAHRVLGDGREVPRRGLRDPRRRARPRLPAPRERDRAVRARRPRVRACLDAQRDAPASSARRCRSRSATSSRSARRSTAGAARRCSSSSWRPLAQAARLSTRRCSRPPRRPSAFRERLPCARRSRRGRLGAVRGCSRRRLQHARGARGPARLARPRASLRRGLEVFGLESLAEQAERRPRSSSSPSAREPARASRDFAEADRLRGEIEAAGWDVRDVDASRLPARSASGELASSSTAGAPSARRCAGRVRCSSFGRPSGRCRPSRGCRRPACGCSSSRSGS